MKDWMKWGLAATLIGIVIEFLMFGNFKFFWLEPRLEDVIGSVVRAYIPGQTVFLILALYFITGAILGKIISRYWLKRG